MLIQVGVKYRVRNGGTVFIEREEENNTRPFFGIIKKQNGCHDRIAYFTHNGIYNPDKIGISDYDIIEKI